jgi:pentatricopeptide repeat protein
MKLHAVERAEYLVQIMKDRHGLVPNTIVWNSVMSAWVKSRDPRAVDRTYEILQLLESNASGCGDAADSDGKRYYPDLISYNTHLHALSTHASPFNDYAKRAGDLLSSLENSIRLSTWESEEAVEIGVAPNVFSYNLVIDAHARSNHGMAAAHTLRRLIRRREHGLEPDTFSFNRVLAALTQTASVKEGTMSVQKIEHQVAVAERLLWYMDETYASGVHSRARPDVTSFATLIHAHAKLGNADRAQRLLDTMKDRSWLRPTRYCYNAAISAWAASGRGLLAARKAEALLEEMQSSDLKCLAPNSHTYNAVLKAWSQSGTRCCGTKAELYLQRMWDLYYAGNLKVKPNDFSYNTVRNRTLSVLSEFDTRCLIRGFVLNIFYSF